MMCVYGKHLSTDSCVNTGSLNLKTIYVPTLSQSVFVKSKLGRFFNRFDISTKIIPLNPWRHNKHYKGVISAICQTGAALQHWLPYPAGPCILELPYNVVTHLFKN